MTPTLTPRCHSRDRGEGHPAAYGRHVPPGRRDDPAGLAGLGEDGLDLVVLENVGNLVCPAEFDTGAVKNAMILSVPEGHDKPLKYPLMFQVCDVVLVNKIDVLPYFDFDMDKCREYVAMRNPQAKVIPICARTGEGMDEWTAWLKEQVSQWQA